MELEEILMVFILLIVGIGVGIISSFTIITIIFLLANMRNN